jgi:hypothetical protein
MLKHLALVITLAACGKGDKCAKVFDKLAPAFDKENKGSDKKMDRDKEVGHCQQQLKEHPEREAVLDCILAISGTPAMTDLMACDKAHGAPSSGGDKKDGKVTEASLMLNKIGKNAKRVFGETSKYPIGKAALTPATDCCKADGGKCAVDPKQWTVEPWSTLEFTIEEPHLFRYTYDGSDGKSFTATAVGDPDCSGKPQTYTLTGTISDAGNPTLNLVKP